MDRTLRATLLAGFIGFAVVAGLGVFLGFDLDASLIAGAVVGVLGGLLIWGAARRADSFAEVAPPPVEPGFPGPPEPDDGSDPDRAPDPPDAEDDRPRDD
ncbi:MAG: hypothetical protein JJT89_09090 [Nitriliruptoraceae bacterium]|nr:hypothetical protein [Nitriliruptoraceae bacterium]